MSEKVRINPGDVYGQLTCVRELPSRFRVLGTTGKKYRVRMVWCRCSCGNHKAITFPSLRSGGSKSCGCLQLSRVTKHGLYSHPLHKTWDAAIQRCCNEKCSNFPNYGAKGIRFHPEWRESFQAFFDYCINVAGWKKGLTIDRINNAGNYEPGNVRFVTIADNLRNRVATEKARQTARISIKKAWKASLKPVRCIETGVCYPTLKAAAAAVGRKNSSITTSIVRGGTCAGFTWEFLSQDGG